MRARVANALLGGWLFLSAFLWPHTTQQRVNAWVAGMIAVTAALAGLGRATWGRYVNAGLGAWLIASAMFLPRLRIGTAFNHVFVGFALIMFAMTPFPTFFSPRRTADV